MLLHTTVSVWPETHYLEANAFHLLLVSKNTLIQQRYCFTESCTRVKFFGYWKKN